ncbi:MAG: YqzL family protein [Armatimonadetes bacterium]|nr:YqzL family protein [Armatimonadota bacterium]
MDSKNEVFWSLFESTGNPAAYLLYRELAKSEPTAE